MSVATALIFAPACFSRQPRKEAYQCGLASPLRYRHDSPRVEVQHHRNIFVSLPQIVLVDRQTF